MRERNRIGIREGRLRACLFACFAAVLACLPAAGAAAQGSPPSGLSTVFRPPGDARQLGRPLPKKPRKAPSAPARKRPPAVPAPVPEPAALPKAADARVVLVAGDGLGHALAGGLTDAFAQTPGLRVVDATRNASGLARTSPTDWPAGLPALVAQNKPAAVVVMLGANDRAAMTENGRRLLLRRDGWTETYAARAEALAKGAAGSAPLLWVGLPAVRWKAANADFLSFNEIFRTAAEGAGGVFIDPWEGFVDEAGVFAPVGPGIDGQTVRLREKDGFGFTRAGRRKLAFFVEKPLAKALASPPAAAQTAKGAAAAGAAPATPGRTEPMPLGAVEPGTSTELLGAAAGPLPISPAEQRKLFDPPPVAGRADDFSAAPR